VSVTLGARDKHQCDVTWAGTCYMRLDETVLSSSFAGHGFYGPSLLGSFGHW